MLDQEKGVDSMASPPDADMGASSVSLDRDDAAKLVGEHAQAIDPEVEARVLKKIDWFLIPAMIVGMFLLVPP
jgi:hypothetical protein